MLAVCDEGPLPLIVTFSPKPDECMQRSPTARAMQGAWSQPWSGGPVGPYGHCCDRDEFKTVCCLGSMSPCDSPPDFGWHPDRCGLCGYIHRSAPRGIAAACDMRRAAILTC